MNFVFSWLAINSRIKRILPLMVFREATVKSRNLSCNAINCCYPWFRVVEVPSMGICSFGKEGGRSKGGKRTKWRQRGFPGTKGKEQWPLQIPAAQFLESQIICNRETNLALRSVIGRRSGRKRERVKKRRGREFGYTFGYQLSLWHTSKNH